MASLECSQLTRRRDKVLRSCVGEEINPRFGVKLFVGKVGKEIVIIEVLAIRLQMVFVRRRLVAFSVHPIPVPSIATLASSPRASVMGLSQATPKSTYHSA